MHFCFTSGATPDSRWVCMWIAECLHRLSPLLVWFHGLQVDNRWFDPVLLCQNFNAAFSTAIWSAVFITKYLGHWMSDSAATCRMKTWRKQVSEAVTMCVYIQDLSCLNPRHVLVDTPALSPFMFIFPFSVVTWSGELASIAL